MMLGVFLIAVLTAAPAVGAQDLREVQLSHLEASVPAAADFERHLLRDLSSYFQERLGEKDVSLQFELLRDGPTQSGVSYPKFYVWVRVAGGETPANRGAVRLAAVEKEHFEVTDFVSEAAIRNDPKGIYSVFPAAVCEKIMNMVWQ
jgi:hypothetical protein